MTDMLRLVPTVPPAAAREDLEGRARASSTAPNNDPGSIEADDGRPQLQNAETAYCGGWPTLRSVEVKRTVREAQSKSSVPLRKGKWTMEEEMYTTTIIREFERGMLGCAPGTTLRSYLSEQLHCDPMRITKKFAGDASIGKRVFAPCKPTPENAHELLRVRHELQEMERRFATHLQHSNLASALNSNNSNSNNNTACSTSTSPGLFKPSSAHGKAPSPALSPSSLEASAPMVLCGRSSSPPQGGDLMSSATAPSSYGAPQKAHYHHHQFHHGTRSTSVAVHPYKRVRSFDGFIHIQDSGELMNGSSPSPNYYNDMSPGGRRGDDARFAEEEVAREEADSAKEDSQLLMDFFVSVHKRSGSVDLTMLSPGPVTRQRSASDDSFGKRPRGVAFSSAL